MKLILLAILMLVGTSAYYVADEKQEASLMSSSVSLLPKVHGPLTAKTPYKIKKHAIVRVAIAALKKKKKEQEKEAKRQSCVDSEKDRVSSCQKYGICSLPCLDGQHAAVQVCAGTDLYDKLKSNHWIPYDKAAKKCPKKKTISCKKRITTGSTLEVTFAGVESACALVAVVPKDSPRNWREMPTVKRYTYAKNKKTCGSSALKSSSEVSGTWHVKTYGLPAGTYDVRLYDMPWNNYWTSQRLQITLPTKRPTITCAPRITLGSPLQVTFSGAESGCALLAVVPKDSPRSYKEITTAKKYVYTGNGKTSCYSSTALKSSGTWDVPTSGLPAGAYEARLYPQPSSSYNLPSPPWFVYFESQKVEIIRPQTEEEKKKKEQARARAGNRTKKPPKSAPRR